MNLTKMTEDLNIHQGLPDQPTLSTTELKQKFDEAGNKLKDYINNILTEDIQTGVGEDIRSAKTSILNAVEESIEEIESGLNNTLNSFKEEITKELQNSIKTQEFTAIIPQGITLLNQRIIKSGNIVHLYIELSLYVKNSSNFLLFALPQEVRPSKDVKVIGLYRSGALDITDVGNANWHEPELLKVNGECNINVGNLAVERATVIATYTV